MINSRTFIIINQNLILIICWSSVWSFKWILLNSFKVRFLSWLPLFFLSISNIKCIILICFSFLHFFSNFKKIKSKWRSCLLLSFTLRLILSFSFNRFASVLFFTDSKALFILLSYLSIQKVNLKSFFFFFRLSHFSWSLSLLLWLLDLINCLLDQSTYSLSSKLSFIWLCIIQRTFCNRSWSSKWW